MHATSRSACSVSYQQLLSPSSPTRGRETLNAALNLKRRYLWVSGRIIRDFGRSPQGGKPGPKAPGNQILERLSPTLSPTNSVGTTPRRRMAARAKRERRAELPGPSGGALGRRRRRHELLSRDLEVDRLEQHVEARPCLRVRKRHPVAEGEEPDALGHARVEARSGLRYSRSEEPAIEPAIHRERHPGDVAGRVARQEHDRAGELLRCPVPAQRHGQRHPPEGVVH
jgi:hypothetical protein